MALSVREATIVPRARRGSSPDSLRASQGGPFATRSPPTVEWPGRAARLLRRHHAKP